VTHSSPAIRHTAPQTTQRYAHLAPSAKLDATNFFGSILEAAQKGVKAEVIPIDSSKPRAA
jgi:hypothetical protein